jgi:hypothetical protein
MVSMPVRVSPERVLMFFSDLPRLPISLRISPEERRISSDSRTSSEFRQRLGHLTGSSRHLAHGAVHVGKALGHDPYLADNGAEVLARLPGGPGRLLDLS